MIEEDSYTGADDLIEEVDMLFTDTDIDLVSVELDPDQEMPTTC